MENKNKAKEEFPLFCDFTCKHASFSDPEIIGACRKEIAVYCTFKKQYNNKNTKCLVHKEK